MNTETIQKARDIWAYMSSFRSKEKSDAIVICCSYDLRVCDHACDLISNGFSDTLVISGNVGNWTRHIYNEPEAQVFFRRAISNGIREEQILLELKATNLGENITFSKNLIPDSKTVTFVSKPNSLLRVMLTAEAQWPEITTYVSCPEIEFPDEVSNAIGIFGAINEMVGDIQRIKEYPSLGFQNTHDMPTEIDKAWKFLMAEGFTEHLMPNRGLQRTCLPAGR